MKPIVHTPDPVLVKKAAEVGKIDKKITRIIEDMRKTLLHADNPKGVGLAAPQIGISLQIFLLRPEETDPMRVFINPVITKQSKKMLDGIPGSDSHVEGCLSIPHVWGIVKRHQSLTLAFQDEFGKKHEEVFTDFEAIIVQHEVDHLHGILFPKRVIEQKGQLYKPGTDADGNEVLEPLEI